MSLVLVLGTVQKSCGPRYVSTQLWLQESFDSQEWQFSGRQRRSWKHRAVVKVIRGHILLLLWNDCAITISDMYVCIYIYIMITIIIVIIVCKSHMRWSCCDHDDKLLRSQRQVLDNWKLKDLKTEASASLREDSLLRARDLRGSEYAEQDSYHITIHFMSSPMSLSFEILYAVFKCI